MRECKQRIEMARSILIRTNLYCQVCQGYNFSERFYELYKACLDHHLDVLYTATTMQAQQAHYPETYKDQGYLRYYIRKMISVTPSRTSWTLFKLEDVTTSFDCFTSTTKEIPPCHPGKVTITSIFKRGPKRTRTSSRRVSFHLKTPESIQTKSMQSSNTSTKNK